MSPTPESQGVLVYGYTATGDRVAAQATLGDQETEVTRWAVEHGYRVVGVYTDHGRSRESRTRLLNRITSRDPHESVSAVCVIRLDRLSRNYSELAAILDQLDEAGVQLHVTKTPTPAIGRLEHFWLSLIREEQRRGVVHRGVAHSR